MNKYVTELEKLGNSDNMAIVGDIVAEYTKPFIPTDTGTMANNYTVQATQNACTVNWNTGALPYTQYQFYGQVMGPNKAVFDENGSHIGWRSPISPKKLTGRMMGTKADIELHDGRVIHIKGYNTDTADRPGPRWTEEVLKDEKSVYKIRFDSGRYLYEAYCLALGINPVGGYQVMGKYV